MHFHYLIIDNLTDYRRVFLVSQQTSACSVAFACEKSSAVRTSRGEHCIRLGLLYPGELSAAILQRCIAFRHPNCKLVYALYSIGVGAQTTLGGTFLPEKYVCKMNNIPEFYIILARKISKIPEFLSCLPEKLTKCRNFT